MSEDALNIAGVLNRDAIAALVSGCDGVPLVSEYRDLTSQLQPNGFDLTVAGVAAWAVAGGAGSVGVSGRSPARTRTARRRYGTRWVVASAAGFIPGDLQPKWSTCPAG